MAEQFPTGNFMKSISFSTHICFSYDDMRSLLEPHRGLTDTAYLGCARLIARKLMTQHKIVIVDNGTLRHELKLQNILPDVNWLNCRISIFPALHVRDA